MGSHKPSVLVVDDHLEMAETLADGLCDSGFGALAVGSGRKGIEALGREPFDAVVTDLRMADADGLEVLAASKRLEAERPVIVMTAYSAIEGALESIRLGAYHYLTKPFKMDELVILLRRALEEQAVRREAKALRLKLREIERAYASWALEQLEGDEARAAKALGIDVKTLWLWLEDDPHPDRRAGE